RIGSPHRFLAQHVEPAGQRPLQYRLLRQIRRLGPTERLDDQSAQEPIGRPEYPERATDNLAGTWQLQQVEEAEQGFIKTPVLLAGQVFPRIAVIELHLARLDRHPPAL